MNAALNILGLVAVVRFGPVPRGNLGQVVQVVPKSAGAARVKAFEPLGRQRTGLGSLDDGQIRVAVACITRPER